MAAPVYSAHRVRLVDGQKPKSDRRGGGGVFEDIPIESDKSGPKLKLQTLNLKPWHHQLSSHRDHKDLFLMILAYP